MPDILTLRQATAFMRLSERSLYDLARGRRVPAALVGGKWLFPRALLERWLNAPADPRDAAQRLDPPPILAGSHDPLLDWAVRQSGCGLALRSGGSLDGSPALRAKRSLPPRTCSIPTAGPSTNRPRGTCWRGGVWSASSWAWRDQGQIVPTGNPGGLAVVTDLIAPGLRVVGRQPRAGSHILLQLLLAEAGVLALAVRGELVERRGRITPAEWSDIG